MPDRTITTRCSIAGAGPAGMMTGLLLARAGIDVVVLEKYPDFFRDFRGDTIHPSTLTVMHELGVLDDFLKLPHQRVQQLFGFIGGERILLADLSHLKVKCPFIALMPQWDFLSFLAAQGQRYPGFHLMMETAADDLITENGCVRGVRAKTREGVVDIRADLVIGADGRHSTVRERAGFVADSLGAPMDVLWFRISRREGDPEQAFGRIDQGLMMILIGRGDYWQCGYLVRKGGFDALKRRGLDAFHQDIATVSPFLKDRAAEIGNWDSVSLLTVAVERLPRWWKNGLLCIGDAAHAMSPIGGVGINLAIQDAIAAANILAPEFKKGIPGMAALEAVQKRREPPTRKTQRLQIFIQNNLVDRVLGRPGRARLPWIMRIARHFPILTRIPARYIALGFLPEHIDR